MKHLKITSLICGGILSVTTGALLAQQSSSSQDPASGSYGAGSSSAVSSNSMRSGNDVRLSQLMNSPVRSQQGKSLGYIRDLTIDPQSGRVEFAILSLSSAGALPGSSTTSQTEPRSNTGLPSTSGASMTGKLIPVPWQLFSQSWSGQSTASSSSTTSAWGPHNLVLNIDESKLNSAPSFDASDWNKLQTGSFDQQVYSHFGVDRNSATGTSGSSISGQGTSSHGSSTHQDSTSPKLNEGSTSPSR
jgi:sporulation protein YlmC with PRC-barrel domain